MEFGGVGAKQFGRPRSSSARKAVAILAVAAVLVFVLGTTFGVATDLFEGPWLTAITCGIPALATIACAGRAARTNQDRLAWSLLAAGFGMWSLAAICRFTFFDNTEARPIPSWVDPIFLAMYPLVLAGLIALIRGRLRNFRYVPLYDGLAGAMVLAAVSYAFLYGRIDTLTGNDRLESMVLLAYPVGDFFLLVAISFALRFSGRSLEGPWPLVGAGLLIFIFADIVFALAAPNSGIFTTALYGTWCLGMVLVMIGAWREDADVRELRIGRRQIFLPLVFVVGAVAVLLSGQARDLEDLAIAFAILAVVLVLLRIGISWREAARLVETRDELVIDQVTGLSSQRVVDDWLSRIDLPDPESVSRNGRSPDERPAVLAIDIHEFHSVNLALGLRAGDRIVSAVGTRLRRAVGDHGRLGRVGSDGFVLIVDRQAASDGEAEVNGAVNEILGALEPPFWIEGLRVYLRPTIGIALGPEHGTTGTDLLRLALLARGRSDDAEYQVRWYSGESDSTRESMELAGELRVGIDRDELALHYQPKVAPQQGAVTSAEALVRWEHPDRGLLGPYHFIGLAEEAGLMQRMTDRILEQAIRQMSTWRDQDGIELQVAVNLAMPNLLDTALPDSIADRLDRAGIPRRNLTLEVTENILMSDPQRVRGNLDALKRAGMRISLDDFGAGTTSLAHLRDLPIDEVKMDRSLVAPMRESGANATIIAASIGIARDLGLDVVAEGVEDVETVDELVKFGCATIQGYYYAKPMAPDLIPDWLRAFPATA